jgi:hypothetical protein
MLIPKPIIQISIFIISELTQPLTGEPNFSWTHPTSHKISQLPRNSHNLSQTHPTSLRLTQPLTDSPNLSETQPTSFKHYQSLPTSTNLSQQNQLSTNLLFIFPPFTTSPHFPPKVTKPFLNSPFIT